MFPQVVTKENIEELLLCDIEQLEDQKLVELGYSLQSVWDNIDEYEFDFDNTILCQRMREVYYAVLSRAQQTNDLERLAILIPSLPYLIYSPNLPEEEDCFEPVDDLVWGFAKAVSKKVDVSQTVKKAAIEALMVGTQGIPMEDLMVEPVYVWAWNNLYHLSINKK